MKIKGKIEKMSFISGTFNTLKGDMPKSITKEENKQQNAVMDRYTTNGLYNREIYKIRSL